MTALDAAACRAVDSTGQFGETLDLAEHLRDAVWRVDSANIAPVDAHGGLIVAGMGGSSVGGRLAIGALGPRLRRPMALAMGYDVPAWIGRETLVLCSSYSGSTEETLATYDAAKAAGAPRLVATTGGPLAERAREDGVPVVPLPGGFQPRAAVGYSLVTALEAAALCGAAPSVRDEIEGAAALAAELAREWGPDGEADGEAKRLARTLHGTFPVITGAGLTASVAYRWKTQINENAKQPAFWHEMPEMDHNEIVAWADGSGSERFSAVFLLDPDQHPRQRRRMELTGELIRPAAAHVELVEVQGESRTSRLLQALMLGDLLSLQLAARRGVDPTPVAMIDRLKDELGRP